jgi:hypothetical protein
VKDENPGIKLAAAFVETFRTDLAIGQCTTSHVREYFEATLPSKPPKPHPGVLCAKVGQYATTYTNVDAAGLGDVNQAMFGIQTHVNLSQAVTDNNVAYNSQQDNNHNHSIAMEEEEGEDTLNVMDESMDTYATKLPEQQYVTLSQESDSPI